MRPQRALVDVSALPTEVFGSRGTGFWGIMCFMAVEGTTLAICAATYFYLSKNFSVWPPENTRAPSLLVPTISLIALLASNGLALAMNKAAQDSAQKPPEGGTGDGPVRDADFEEKKPDEQK